MHNQQNRRKNGTNQESRAFLNQKQMMRIKLISKRVQDSLCFRKRHLLTKQFKIRNRFDLKAVNPLLAHQVRALLLQGEKKSKWWLRWSSARFVLVSSQKIEWRSTKRFVRNKCKIRRKGKNKCKLKPNSLILWRKNQQKTTSKKDRKTKINRVSRDLKAKTNS